MLAVVWSAEHFHLYLYGTNCVIYTDHKPLLCFFKRQHPSYTRIERWRRIILPAVLQAKAVELAHVDHQGIVKTAPWKNVSLDFLGPIPTGEYLLEVMDDYSSFPEVEKVTSIAAPTVNPKLDSIFARQGIPELAKSDISPPFNGTDFEKLSRHLGFYHRKITPIWQQANGEVERFIAPLMKAIRATHIEHDVGNRN